MTWRTRLTVVGLIVAAMLLGALLLASVTVLCPTDTPDHPCPDYARNRAVIVALAATAAALAVTPFAFLAEFIVRRRIVYRGAWWRAARRGALVGVVVAALAGLRLGGVISVPVGIFVVVLALLAERVASSRAS